MFSGAALGPPVKGPWPIQVPLNPPARAFTCPIPRLPHTAPFYKFLHPALTTSIGLLVLAMQAKQSSAKCRMLHY